MLQAWEKRAKEKRESVKRALQKYLPAEGLTPTETGRNVMQTPQKLLSEDVLTITESNPLIILENIQARVWSAVSVTRAFCQRAALAHQLVNCLTEVLFDDAIAAAQELDDYQARTGGFRGPLHGLPMSFMDRYRIAGSETAAGYVAWLGNKETEETESFLVQQMRRLGAVPFCKTNLAMSMMLGETTNNIMGSTSNPYARHLNSGGAAGGEGALVALKGSPFGWGFEVAGSSRIPAAFNGVYSLKTSTGRLTCRDIASNNPTSPVCPGTAAPLCGHLASLSYVMKIVLGHAPVGEDPGLLDMPWREEKAMEARGFGSRRPVFAVMLQDDLVRPHPPIQRALAMAIEALRIEGCEVLTWSPPAHGPAVEKLFKIFGADGARSIRNALLQSAEPPVAPLRKWFYAQEAGSLSVADFWDLNQQRDEYLNQYAFYWNSTRLRTQSGRPVDGVIMPVAPAAAAEENKLHYFSYSAIVNFLDFTACAFPVTFANQLLDPRPPPRDPLSEQDRIVLATYNPEVFDGAPAGLQIMCRRLEEEKVLGLVHFVEEALKRCVSRI